MKFKTIILSLLMIGAVFTTAYTGVEKNTDSDSDVISLKISPNPVTSGNVTFHFKIINKDIVASNATIHLSNLIGQQVYSIKLSETDIMKGYISLEVERLNLDKGIYFVKFSVAEYTKVQKMILR